MNDFVVGQRWLSETETSLGLGIVQQSDYRLVSLYFPGAEQERAYAKDNAPLARVQFKAGDDIELVNGERHKVLACKDVEGLFFYQVEAPEDAGRLVDIPETQLNHTLKLKRAQDRLFSRQIDSPRWFELRHAALQAQEHVLSRKISGLAGARVELIPHQLYIAHEVAQRYAPRVLLADEVGLGKTIEAGLIIHQQLLNKRAERVLVVVPKSLTHQWFVEMYRRFNLHFSIFDALRVEQSTNTITDNPFMSEQLVLCSHDFLLTDAAEAAFDVEWDLLVVDEAHHLDWREGAVSPEYQKVEALSRQAKGLLLLTATPEQLGIEGHFARLRLLDPYQFSDLHAFLAQQERYADLAALVDSLQSGKRLSQEDEESLGSFLEPADIVGKSNDELIDELLACYGTGRVLFRNTRKNVKGFPARKVYACPLPNDLSQASGQELLAHLYPESASLDDSWCQHDGRVEWLVNFCRHLAKEKILLICALKDSAVDLELYLRYRKGMKTAVFHEDMDLVSRDRAAAYFADEEDGAQILVCSEIGSEGRNFQFSSHLVLFDLPLIPDLLEQRIGRLDRIGQKNTVSIHVPFFENSAQHRLFDWYHLGMNAFEQTNPAGETIYAHCETLLLEVLSEPGNEELRQALIDRTKELTRQLRQELEQGRDRLLEKASYNERQAMALLATVEEEQHQQPKAFLESVFDRFGIHTEELSAQTSLVQPTEHMYVSDFPYLPEDGLSITYERETALGREDVSFMTWEHPMTLAAIDLVLSQEKGKACVALIRNKSVKPGTLLLECLFKVEVVAPKALQTERFFDKTVIRVLLDAQGRDLSNAVSHDNLNKQVYKISKGIGKQVLTSEEANIATLLLRAETLAKSHGEAIRQSALSAMEAMLSAELKRFAQLKRRNALIRDEELSELESRRDSLRSHLAKASCQLDALRVLVTVNE